MNEKIQYLVDNLREANKEIRFRDSTEDVNKIPKIITKYLFNRKEEENMMNIIQNIQKHDLTIRQDIKDFRQNNNPADF